MTSTDTSLHRRRCLVGKIARRCRKITWQCQSIGSLFPAKWKFDFFSHLFDGNSKIWTMIFFRTELHGVPVLRPSHVRLSGCAAELSDIWSVSMCRIGLEAAFFNGGHQMSQVFDIQPWWCRSNRNFLCSTPHDFSDWLKHRHSFQVVLVSATMPHEVLEMTHKSRVSDFRLFRLFRLSRDPPWKHHVTVGEMDVLKPPGFTLKSAPLGGFWSSHKEFLTTWSPTVSEFSKLGCAQFRVSICEFPGVVKIPGLITIVFQAMINSTTTHPTTLSRIIPHCGTWPRGPEVSRFTLW